MKELLDLDSMRVYIFWGIRILACLVGAALSWYLASPLFRGLYRVFSPRRGIPGSLLFPLRLVSAGVTATAVFVFLPLGGGGGGWGGLGPGAGPGEGPGKGPGDGSGIVSTNNDPSVKSNNPGKVNTEPSKVREKIEIEMVPDEKDTKRFYLLKIKNPKTEAGTLEDVKKWVAPNKATWEVHITFNSDGETPTETSPAVRKLESLLDEQGIPHTKEKNK